MEEKDVRTLVVIVLGAITAYLTDIPFAFYGFIIAGFLGGAYRVLYLLREKSSSNDER